MKKDLHLELIKKYGKNGEISFGGYSEENPDLIYILYRKGNDYLLVTSEGEEYTLRLETLDKVRDICCNNMRGLLDYELRVLEKFPKPLILEVFAVESMKRFFEKEAGYRIGDSELLSVNYLLQVLAGPDRNPSKDIEDESGIGIGLKSSSGICTRLLIKTASDISFEREEFLKRIHLKKRSKKG